MIINTLKHSLVLLLFSFLAACGGESNTNNTSTTSQSTEQSTTTTANTASEKDSLEENTDEPIYTVSVTPIKTKEDLKNYDVYGDYWNRMDIKDVEDGDQYIGIGTSDQKEVWADLYFEEYVASLNADEEVEVSAKIDCAAQLTLTEAHAFALNKEDEYCLDGKTKLYFIQEGDVQGISFDGKTFAYYKSFD